MNEFIKQIKVASEMLVKEYGVKDIYVDIAEKLNGEKEINITLEV